MTKCNFCYDSIDAGSPPSCVAACPLRVLDYGTTEKLESGKQSLSLWQLPASEHPFPLPDYSRTEPHLSIKPHPGMNIPLGKAVANREEILPPQSFENNRGKAELHELPLVAFTLLMQTAVGLTVCSLAFASVPTARVVGCWYSVGCWRINFIPPLRQETQRLACGHPPQKIVVESRDPFSRIVWSSLGNDSWIPMVLESFS